MQSSMNGRFLAFEYQPPHMPRIGINVRHCGQKTIAFAHVGILFASEKKAPLTRNLLEGITMYKCTCPEFWISRHRARMWSVA
jgi:hypothetical protein